MYNGRTGMPKNILIADDDPGILEVVKIILEEDGEYRVVTVSDGSKVESVIKQDRPDLILLDIWMPGMDGRELTKRLKSDPKVKNTPILLISAYDDIEGKAKEAGADGFIEKPFDIGALKGKVSAHI